MSPDDSGDVPALGGSPHHFLDKSASPLDLTERPEHARQKGHHGNTDVLAETEGEIVVSPWLEQRERAFQVVARLLILTGEPMGGPEDAMRDTGLGQIVSYHDVAQESRRMRPHRRQLAAHEAARPQTVIDREPLARVLNSCR